MDRPVLSLCLIARDEEEHLGRCLAAAAPLVDEIVVADTGSTDRTREVAVAYGARVVDVPWRDDFAAARNACLGAATGAWVLVLDADETLQPSPRDALAARLGDPAALAYTVELISDHGGGRVETAHLARLFRNCEELRYEGRVHEQILPALCRALGRETWLPPRSGLVATHDGYRPEVRAARGKLERNLRLLRAEIAARPDDPGPRFFLARELTPRAGGTRSTCPRRARRSPSCGRPRRRS